MNEICLDPRPGQQHSPIDKKDNQDAGILDDMSILGTSWVQIPAPPLSSWNLDKRVLDDHVCYLETYLEAEYLLQECRDLGIHREELKNVFV